MVGSFVSEDTGTWFEICEDQPNFYTGEYTNGQRVPATWDSSISYLGMDDRGWICSVSLFRMDSGRTQRETLAMMPDDYGGGSVMHTVKPDFWATSMMLSSELRRNSRLRSTRYSCRNVNRRAARSSPSTTPSAQSWLSSKY